MHNPARFSVIIHNVRSILNVGAMFRTADGAGVDKIYLTGYTPGPDTHPDKMTKTALGADGVMAWERVRRVGDVVRRLRAEDVQIVALEQSDHAIDYRRFKPRWPLALMVGNEVTGIPRVSHNITDAMIEIPMRGAKESLNVAVALGIAAYELARKRP